MLGLVEVPGIFGTSDLNGPPGQHRPDTARKIQLRKDPKEGAAVAAVVSSSEEIESREHGYEESSAVVFGREHGWFLIRAKNGKGWLAASDAGKFRSYEELLKDNLTFLTANWDGSLQSSPGGGQVTRLEVSRDKGNYASWETPLADVMVLGSKTVSSRLWFEVQMVSGRCVGEETLGKKGWIPAYNDRGGETVWFYSRSC